jgi:signal transduction histidine kinase
VTRADVATVLVVEDNPGDARLTELALQRAGVSRVLHADRLASAVDLLEERTVDAVLLDLHLPDVHRSTDGVELLTARFPDIPVVVLTGSVGEDSGPAAVAVGAQDFIGKAEMSAARLRVSLGFARQRHDARRLLRLQRDALRRSAGELDTLNQRLAHDTLNSLTSMTGLAELLAGGALDPAQREEAAGRVARRGREATATLEAVLRAALEAQVELTPTDLTTVAREAVAAVDATDLDVEVHDLPTLETSGVLVRNVLENLLRNAARHAAPVGTTVRVEITARPTTGAWLVTVEDDGRGIPAERVEEVFTHGARASDAAGHGVGLASVRTTVEQLGGVAWAERSHLGGAAVRFSLPDTETA